MLLFRGFFWINIILSPIHIFMILIAVSSYPGPGVYRISTQEEISRILFSIFMTLGTQAISLLSLIVFTKLWDCIFCKVNLYSMNVNLKSIKISALINSLAVTILGNLYIDNLFAFRNGNYDLVVMPFWVLIAYYFICYAVGAVIHKPKWLT
jgi:hypothetical protein